MVAGGGLSPDGLRWVSCRQGFFLSVKVLARLFRRLFLTVLTQAFENGKLTFHGTSACLAKPHTFHRLLASLRAREWCVYAKPPFGGPEQVLAYLGRYTHRLAISNHRLLKLENGQVTFSWKDYARGNQQRLMTLKTDEFIRRFLLHVLPRGFQRIRQFGLLANRQRRYKLALCRTLLGAAACPTTTNQPLPRDYQSLYQTVTLQSLKQCPACHAGTMKLTQCLPPLSSAVVYYALHRHRPEPQAIDSS